MKLARFVYKKMEAYGVLTFDKVICLPELGRTLNEQFPVGLDDFVISCNKILEKTEKLLEDAAERELKRVSYSLKNVAVLSPISFPRKIVCLGLNYRDHAAEQGVSPPDEPIIFMKPHSTLVGPNDCIVKPSFVTKLDYEAELAIVVGRKAKNIPVSKARSYIFGYTIFNDISARNIQFKDKQWTRGKSFDTFAPVGPCITTENQLKDTSKLAIRTWVNRELRQNSTTKNMVFNVYEVLHHISRVMTLEPCDIIATGTPAGVGFALKPEPKFLQHGDKIKIEIQNIGVLENSVVEG